MARPVRVVVNAADIQRLAQSDDVKDLLRSAASSALPVARSGAPSEGGFSSSFSVREGTTGSGQRAYVWARLWNDSPIANLVEFGAPKRKGPRPRGRYLGRAFNTAVGRLIGGG